MFLNLPITNVTMRPTLIESPTLKAHANATSEIKETAVKGFSIT